MKRILIVDDHIMVGRSIAALLRRSSSAIEAEALGTMTEAYECLEHGEKFDLILLDYDMPEITGLEGLKTLKQCYPNQTIGMISGITDAKAIEACIIKGAIGWIPKTMDEKPLIHAIDMMIAGSGFVPSDVIVQVSKHRERWNGLTAKEVEIADLLSDGYSDKAIANHLGISPRTAQNHVRALLKKAEVDNRTKFAAVYKSDVNNDHHTL